MISSMWRRIVRGTRQLEQQPEWLKALGPDWASDIMTVQVTDDFHAKQGRSTGRWVIEANGQRLSVYLKRHYRLPWWRGLLAALFAKTNWSPALQEWHHLNWAMHQGFPVPMPVAAAEYVGPWFRLQSMLAIKELVGMLPLHQAIPLAKQRLSPPVFLQWKRLLIAELARLTQELHQRRHYHKDLYLCHFYLPRHDIEGWHHAPNATFQGRLHMIDLHRLGHHPWTWPLWQWKDLAQLLYSSEIEGVSASDRLRFWQLYRGHVPRSRWMRWLEWCIRLKWARYRDHNRKRERRSRQGHPEKRAAA
jgi:hypothetical protein